MPINAPFEYKLYTGKDLASINGDVGLKGVLEMLQENERVRIAMIHNQKFATSVSIGIDELLDRGYMTREGNETEFLREEKDTAAMINFSKVLRDQFPEDWKNTIVRMYQGSVPIPQDQRCPSCHWKLTERKKVDGYTCRNTKCAKAYKETKGWGGTFTPGLIFKHEQSIGTIVLEPNLDYQVSLVSKH